MFVCFLEVTQPDSTPKKSVYNTIELLSDLMDTLDDLDQFMVPETVAEEPPQDSFNDVDSILSALEDLKQSI